MSESPEAMAVLALQRSLATLAFMEDPSPMLRDPEGFARTQGLPPSDQAAFQRYRERLLVYRSGIRNNLTEPIEDAFPITLALLERAGAWTGCLAAFLATRPVRSIYYRDIAPTFLGWLAATGWGLERWPYLLQLAHCEILPELVAHCPEEASAEGLATQGGDRDRVVLAPSTQVVSYDYAVHLSTPEEPEPAPGAQHLLLHRDAQGRVHWTALTPATAALLVKARTLTIGEAIRDLGLTDADRARALLTDLCAQGVILGFLR